MLNFSMNDLLGVLAKILNAFKQLMGWLKILVLPDEDQKQYYPEATTAAQEENP